MNEHDPFKVTQRGRERLLYQYIGAVERGDFGAVAGILAQAADDEVLEQMVLEVNEVRSASYITMGLEVEHLVRQLLADHIPSGLVEDEEVYWVPLTVGDVAARIRDDAATGLARREALRLAERIKGVETPLPHDLSQRSVHTLLEGLGVAVSESFQKVFRETAILLSMRRQQGQASLAATRRQRTQGRPPAENPEPRQ